jgi:hypothetical protein
MALRNRRRERRRLCQKAAAEARRKAAHEALTLSALLKDWQALHLSSKRPRYAAEAVRALRAEQPGGAAPVSPASSGSCREHVRGAPYHPMTLLRRALFRASGDTPEGCGSSERAEPRGFRVRARAGRASAWADMLDSTERRRSRRRRVRSRGCDRVGSAN